MSIRSRDGYTRSSSPPPPYARSLSPVVGCSSLARPPASPAGPTEGKEGGWVGLGIVFEFDNKPGKYPNSIGRASLTQRQREYGRPLHANSYKTESNLPSLMPARSIDRPSTLNEGEAQNPLAFHFISLTSHSPSAISVSRARLWHLLRSAIKKRSHHRSHASSTPHPRLRRRHRSSRGITTPDHSAAYYHPSRTFHLQNTASDSSMQS